MASEQSNEPRVDATGAPAPAGGALPGAGPRDLAGDLAGNRASPPASDSASESASDPADRPAWRAPFAWLTLGVVFVAGLWFDLWTKYWAFDTIAGYPVELERERILNDASFLVPHHARVHALPWDLLDYRLVLNHGAVFGIGQQRRELFIVFTVLATAAALALFAFGTRARNRTTHVAIGLILAGGLGNLYDRIFYGAVRDFLHMLPGWQLPFGWHWPGNSGGDVFPWVFNIADVLLLSGMGLFIVTSWIEDRRARREQAALAATAVSAASGHDR